MNNKDFRECEIPYNVLKDYGLTREMIEDLPQEVMNKFLSGYLSPKLPLTLHTSIGNMQIMSKLRLERNIGGTVDVFFLPELGTSKLSMYSEEEQEKLLRGEVITSFTNPNMEDNDRNTLFYVQYDDQINQVLFAPVEVIKENIILLSHCVQLDEDDKEMLMDGLPITNKLGFENRRYERVTFGVDLRYPTGIFVTNSEKAEKNNKQEGFTQKYNFGINGVWIADGDSAYYVKEEDYTDEIKLQMSSAIKQNQDNAETRGYRR